MNSSQFDDRVGSIASEIQQSELTAIPDIDEIAVNCPKPARRRRQRDYIGCISPKTIKGITYQYWVWREKGKRHYRCMGTDRASANDLSSRKLRQGKGDLRPSCVKSSGSSCNFMEIVIDPN